MCSICTQLEDFEKRMQAVEKKFIELNPIIEKMQKNGIKEIYSVKEAAKIIGRSAYTVSEWCRTGKMSATRSGAEGMWFITAESLIKFTKKSA